MADIKYEVNEDLQKERNQRTFDIDELIHYIDGGEEKTLQRRELEDYVLKDEALRDIVSEENLSHKEKYEMAIRKSCLLRNILKVKLEQLSDLSNYRDIVSGQLSFAVMRDGSPFSLHYIMFLPTIMGQGTVDQQAEWLGRAWNMNIVGTYAQTELGHGTFIRGLETTATYDAATKEFVIHSPTLTSYKWWPGGLGQTANYCIVVAQLYTQGKCHGIHQFIVQLRDEETHMPLPGIKVGEIGAKMGYNTVNNGYLGLENFRIPRQNMLMKNSQVLEDGTYVTSPSSKLAYGTMIFVRVVIVKHMTNYLSVAVTIAMRYSAVRRQSKLKPNLREPQIMDYLTQQHKLFIGIATCHAFRTNANWLWEVYRQVVSQLAQGDLDLLPELHALACCLKAISTADSAAAVERCRLACGGHGYMQSSNLPLMYGLVTGACTYEGENTVLLLQTARFLVKAWQEAVRGGKVTPTVAYLAAQYNGLSWENSVLGIIQGFQIVAERKIASCVSTIQTRTNTGMAYEDAWNMTSVQLTAASEAHGRAVLLSTYHVETQKANLALSPALAQVLQQLVELYSVYWALEKVGDLLRYTTISKENVEALQLRYEELLIEIRPNAVSLVDAFDLRDEIVHSTLGSYDGRVYERLMDEALRSPLNAEPVNDSFHKYLKPFMQGKL